jgi:hypothetical protein
MRNHASYLALMGAVSVLLGCDPGTIIDIDVSGTDTGPTDVPVVPGDTPDAPRADTGAATCGSTGQVGGHCRDGMCAATLTCTEEFMFTGGDSLRNIFDIPPGEEDPENPGFFRATDPVDMADDVSFQAFTGSLCSALCNTELEFDETATSGELDTCGPCAACTTQINQLGLAPSYIFLANTAAGRPFGENTGFCRANCTFNPDTNGGCPTGYTCDPGSLVCVEACESNNECSFELQATRQGELVTILDPENGTCNLTTGRCESGTGTTSTGMACEGSGDCSEDVGVCLRGGVCGEYNCGFASDTSMTDGTCDGGAGICLGAGADNATLCYPGCDSPMDCVPGATCLPLTTGSGMPVDPIGPMGFTGVCLGICDTVPSDPDGSGPLTAADDDMIQCRPDEGCDMPLPTDDDEDPVGNCRPTCDADADCTTENAASRCDIPMGESTGFCRIPDQICNETEDCILDQVCDQLAWEGNLGLCIAACDDNADCTSGDECDTERGVCRTPCGTGLPDCVADVEVCQANYCEQLTMM